jgi:PII-like signaling protein
MHQKFRLELIIERMALQRARAILEDAELTGYTILDAAAGFGGGRRWRSGDLSTAEAMSVVIAIGDKDKIDRALVELHELIEAQIGVLSVSAVEVLRPDRF